MFIKCYNFMSEPEDDLGSLKTLLQTLFAAM